MTKKEKKMLEIKATIDAIATKYGVRCLRAIFNIQATLDIELDQNIYCKEQAKMEQEIKNAVKPYIVNDIYYRDIA